MTYHHWQARKLIFVFVVLTIISSLSAIAFVTVFAKKSSGSDGGNSGDDKTKSSTGDSNGGNDGTVGGDTGGTGTDGGDGGSRSNSNNVPSSDTNTLPSSDNNQQPTISGSDTGQQQQQSSDQQLQSLTTDPAATQTPPASETPSSAPVILPCPVGQHFDNLQLKCLADSSSAEAVQKPGLGTSGLTGVPASGDADKIATPNPAASCLVGQHLDESGRCVSNIPDNGPFGGYGPNKIDIPNQAAKCLAGEHVDEFGRCSTSAEAVRQPELASSLISNGSVPITKPQSVQKPGFGTSSLTGVQPTAPLGSITPPSSGLNNGILNNVIPPDSLAPKSLASQTECVPGYHWDSSQQQCVPN